MKGQVGQSEDGQDLGEGSLGSPAAPLPPRRRWAILRPGVRIGAHLAGPGGATGGFRAEEGFERNCQLSEG